MWSVASIDVQVFSYSDNQDCLHRLISFSNLQTYNGGEEAPVSTSAEGEVGSYITRDGEGIFSHIQRIRNR